MNKVYKILTKAGINYIIKGNRRLVEGKTIYLYKSFYDIEAIKSLLKIAKNNSTIKFKPYRKWDVYTSFSLKQNPHHRYGAGIITFDYNSLKKSNKLIPVKYTKEFLRKNMDIFQHIIADKQTIDEHIENEGYTEKNWLTSFKQGYASEKEVVAPLKLKLNKSDIVNVKTNHKLKYFKEFKDDFNIGEL